MRDRRGGHTSGDKPIEQLPVVSDRPGAGAATPEQLAAAKDLLVANGYLVSKIPVCKWAGRGHGKHVLLTRSARCPGEEPMPHKDVGGYQNFLGFQVLCACGDSFSDTPWNDDPESKTDWTLHKELHGIA